MTYLTRMPENDVQTEGSRATMVGRKFIAHRKRASIGGRFVICWLKNISLNIFIKNIKIAVIWTTLRYVWIKHTLVRLHGVSRYVVLFMKNIILSTAFWCKALLQFDGVRNEDCWLTRTLKPVCCSCIHNTYLIIRVYIYMHEMKYLMHLNAKIFVKATCSQGKPTRTSPFISYLNPYMSTLCF